MNPPQKEPAQPKQTSKGYVAGSDNHALEKEYFCGAVYKYLKSWYGWDISEKDNILNVFCVNHGKIDFNNVQ